MEIIGISGYARAGKDEVAKTLVKAHGFTRVAFADKLREVLYALDPIVGDDWTHAITKPDKVTVQDVIDKYTWEGYKVTEYGTEIRRLLQRLGTEAGRQTLWENIWVDAALTGLPADAKVVIPDVRFPNEAQAIKDWGGTVWRITRPGFGPANDHESETALDDWEFDYTYDNDGSLVDLALGINKAYILKSTPRVEQQTLPQDATLRSHPLQNQWAPEGVVTSSQVPKRR